MAAYFETGFSVRQPMWHGMGTVADEYPEDWAQARKWAGLEWEPGYQDLYIPEVWTPDPDFADDPALTQAPMPDGSILVGPVGTDGSMLYHVPVQGHQAIIRDDTRAVLAVPTDKWKIISHDQMGELLEAYTEQWTKAGAKVKFETAGSLRGGGMVWALVWLDEPYNVPGDDSPTYPFAALLNAHDGSAACKLINTQVRIVCWNTWNAASNEAERSGKQVILRHQGNVAEKIEQAKITLASMRDDAKAWQMQATDLAGININDAVVRTFLDEFIPIPENATDRTRNSRLERQATFMGLYNASPTCAPLPESAYKLVQCAGEYLDHLRPFRSRDTYMARTMLSAEPIKAGTIQLVRELAKELVDA